MSGHIPTWGGRRVTEALQQVKARGRQGNLPCCICKQPIDYALPSTDPDGCSVQHLKPRSIFPHLTWDPSNWAPSHLQCNKAAGTEMNLGLGTTSREWG